MHVAENDGGHADALVLGGGGGDGLGRAVEEVGSGVEGAGDEFLDAGFGGLVDEGWRWSVGVGGLRKGSFEGVHEGWGDVGVDEDSIC